jgi:threonine dehydrogenase-like Zn-dependent dehydrogenase
VQAVVFTAEAQIELAQRPEPVAGDGEILIEVGAAGICGADLHAPVKPAIFTPGVVLGHEFSGTVAGLAAGVGASSGGALRAEPGQPVVVNPIALSCGQCEPSRLRRDVAVVCGAGQAVPPGDADRIDTGPLTTAVVPLGQHEKAFAALRDPEQAVKVFLDPGLISS